MARIENKLEQIRLQHDIAEILWKDNGVSSHFDYHVNPVSSSDTVKLNLLTYNPKHDEYMLLHSVSGASSIECLDKMQGYLKTKHNTKVQYTFTINWKKMGDATAYTSYFVASHEEEARKKFLHEKNPADYDFSIQMNPLS